MKKNLLLVCGGILLGVVGFIAFRFITYQSDIVHYHANFALRINGQQDKFDGPGYYEEVQTCNVHDKNDAHGRAHMHGRNNHVVHVHAYAVTWGAFLANLGYGLADKSLETPKGVFVNGTEDNQLTFILNGKPVKSVANKVIKSEDVLLINYGKDDEDSIKKSYGEIPRDAHQANVTADPAACTGSQDLTFGERLKRAAGINQASH